MLRSAIRIAALLPLLALPAAAQYSIKNIAIRGAAPYTEAEVLEVSGLQPGQKMAQSSLANAAQHLLDTGVFSDAQISLSGTNFACTVHIDLKPVPPSAMAVASFTNLVWWTPDELDAALRKAVPFYRGAIPAAGNLPDSVNAALTSLLAAKGIHATVVNTQVQPTDAHPQLTWEFRVDDPGVRLAAVHLRGALPSSIVPALQRTVSRASGTPYNEGLSGVTMEDLLLSPLRDAGYADAQLTGISREVAQTASGYTVSYTATIAPGDIAHLGTVNLQPTPLYSQESFAHDSRLHTGDLVSPPPLLATEQAMVNACLHLGYLDAFVDAHPQRDAAAHTVNYSLQLIPGEVYRIHTVTPLHLSPDAQKDFDSGWRLNPGDVYDPLYPPSFLTSNTALQKLAGYTASFQASADPQMHLVDLTLNFVHSSGQ